MPASPRDDRQCGIDSRRRCAQSLAAIVDAVLLGGIAVLVWEMAVNCYDVGWRPRRSLAVLDQVGLAAIGAATIVLAIAGAVQEWSRP